MYSKYTIYHDIIFSIACPSRTLKTLILIMQVEHIYHYVFLFLCDTNVKRIKRQYLEVNELIHMKLVYTNKILTRIRKEKPFGLFGFSLI